ncbi:hypothetical protein [Streptomyces noursei]|uniref:hypothetical protein n=1 Tax=Streptomyces noursei TaxID=1971 RepID=UPI00069D5810|nr:hypothetical protein [Streptomyces noursei]
MGEGEFVVGAHRVGEGDHEGEEGLGDSSFARGVVVFGFGPRGFEGGGAVDVAVGPVDVGQDAVVPAFPAQVRDGGEGGGEVAADAGEVGQPAAAARGEPAATSATRRYEVFEVVVAGQAQALAQACDPNRAAGLSTATDAR